MHQFCDRLSLDDELPSVRQLNLDRKGMLETVRAAMRQAGQLYDDMAEVNPDIAMELKHDDDAMKSFYGKMYLEIMRRVSVLKEQEAEADLLQLVKELFEEEESTPGGGFGWKTCR